MNGTLNTYLKHRSIRSYKDKMIKKNDLELVIKSAQAAPSSINGQQVSIIAITDKEKKATITELCGNQLWIDEAPVFLLFVADFYRAKLAADKNNVPFGITDGLEASLVASVDVGLSMGNAIGTAESLGYGTVCIGGARSNPTKMVELLNLPEYVYPICGLCIGYPKDESTLKPRLPKEAVYHEETYNKELRPLIDQYDKTMSAYMKERTNGENDRNWSEGISNFYKTNYSPHTRNEMKKQGFKNE
ncbi:NADPH-dependent oxidoreductase [Haloplasma contractile]|nr:NADPH-dependent oxidoreductase [Haloplasma contractile]